MKIFTNLQDLLIYYISLGYIIEFSTFGESLSINLSKKQHSCEIKEFIIKQVVPKEYLYIISKLDNLLQFMKNKLDEIILKNTK